MVAVYVPGGRLFLISPAVLASLQVSVTVGIPPVRFRFMLPSFAPKQEILETIGLTVNIGASGIIMDSDLTQPKLSVTVMVYVPAERLF